MPQPILAHVDAQIPDSLPLEKGNSQQSPPAYTPKPKKGLLIKIEVKDGIVISESCHFADS